MLNYQRLIYHKCGSMNEITSLVCTHIRVHCNILCLNSYVSCPHPRHHHHHQQQQQHIILVITIIIIINNNNNILSSSTTTTYHPRHHHHQQQHIIIINNNNISSSSLSSSASTTTTTATATATTTSHHQHHHQHQQQQQQHLIINISSSRSTSITIASSNLWATPVQTASISRFSRRDFRAARCLNVSIFQVETRLWELRWGTFQRQHSFCNICLWPPPHGGSIGE